MVYSIRVWQISKHMHVSFRVSNGNFRDKKTRLQFVSNNYHYFFGSEIINTLSPRRIILFRFFTLSSVISSESIRMRFRCSSKVCSFPCIIWLFLSLIKTTLLIQPLNILAISEDNCLPENNFMLYVCP